MAPRAIEERATIIAPYVAQAAQKFDGADGSWSTFYLSVGTPPQAFRVLPGTVDSIVYVPLTEGCGALGLQYIDNCGALRGANDSNSRGFSGSGSSSYVSYGNANLYPNQNAYPSSAGTVFGDTVTLPGTDRSTNITLKNQLIGGEIQIAFWLGSFGLGNNRVQFASSPTQGSLLSYMKNQSVIPSLSYAYHAGRAYARPADYGSLIIGGYDSSKMSSNIVSLPVTNNNGKQLLNIGVQSMFASNTYDGNVQVVALSTPVTASIDSSLTQMWMPSDVCDVVAKSFGLEYDSLRELYTVSDTVHTTLQQKNTSLTLRVGGDSAGYTNIVLNYNALDLQAGIPFFNQSTKYFPLKRAANSSQIALGRVFLQETYLVVDWERQNFTVGPVVKTSTSPDVIAISAVSSSSTATSTPSVDGSAPGSSSSGIGAGAIAGIVIAMLVLIAAVGAFFFWRHKKKTRKHFRLSTMSWYTPEAPPPPYGTEPEYYGADKAEGEPAEDKTPKPQLSELYGSTEGPSELNSDNVKALERSELESPPIVAELADDAATKSELDGNSVRDRDSMQSGIGTTRSSGVVSPRRTSTIAERGGVKSPVSPLFELE